MSVTESSTTIRQGIDVERFQQFREYAEAHPEEVQYLLTLGHWNAPVVEVSPRTGTAILSAKDL